jgi:tetratricopeptide (TPR) repeat protein
MTTSREGIVDSRCAAGGSTNTAADSPPIPREFASETAPAALHLLMISIVGIVLRLANVYATRDIPFVQHLGGDAASYFNWAEVIAQGHWIGSEPFYQAPGYPYFLALIMILAAPSVQAIRCVQAVLGGLGAIVLAIGAGHRFDKHVGLTTGWLWALYGPAIYYDGIIQKASFGGAILSFLYLLLILYERKRHWALGTLAGIALGVLCITRENAQVWIPIVLVWIALACSRREAPRSWQRLDGKGVAAFILGLTLILGTVALRNYSVAGTPSISTYQMGPNLYIGNSHNATGRYVPLVPGHETPVFERADATRLAEEALGHPATPAEVSRYWTRQTLHEITADPARWIQLSLRKFAMVWNRYEVPDVESLTVFSAASPILSILGSCLHFGVVLPLAVLGFWYTKDRWRTLWLEYSLLATMGLAVAAFFILGRYRFPLAPILVVFAATGVVKAVRRLRIWRQQGGGIPRSLWGPAVGATVLALLVNLPIHPERQLNAAALMNAGATYASMGDLTRAEPFFERAAEAHRALPAAQFNLARVRSELGDPEGAIASFRAALDLEPRLPDAHFFLARELEKTGDTAGAIRHYTLAVRLNPRDHEADQAIQRLQGAEP